jgi:hypothetical protein
MLPDVSSPRPRFVVCEDGTEYIDRFRRFLGETFEFVPARAFAEALAALPGSAGLLLDLDFRRTPPEALVDEAGAPAAGLAPRAGLDEGMRRHLAESQGILVLRALRARAVVAPAILFADLDDAARARFLEESLGPLTILSSRAGMREIAALLRGMAAP